MRKKLKISFSVLLFFTCLYTKAQNMIETPQGIYNIIKSQDDKGTEFKPMSVFTDVNNDITIEGISKQTFVEYNKNVFDILYSNNATGITVPITIKGKRIELKLIRVNIFSDDINITTSTAGHIGQKDYTAAKESLGIHFYGYIVGQERSSYAALSIFKNQVYGMFSGDGMFNQIILKLNQSGDNTHIIYSSEDVEQNNDPTCSTPDPTYDKIIEYEKQQSEFNELLEQGSDDDGDGTGDASQHSDKCVKVFLEVSNDIYNHWGANLSDTRDFAIALFSQSAGLYLNEGVLLKAVHVNVWTNTSPYEAWGGLVDKLTAFQNTWGLSYPADMAHLIDDGVEGGIAAKVHLTSTSFCAKASERMCLTRVGSPSSYYQTQNFNFALPNFHRFVKVFTHEMGHLLGSPHTHQCFWNGNFSAIDGCAPVDPFNGNNCPQIPAAPINQGTIMSYCDHLSSGSSIDFRLGFGSQPSARLFSVLSFANCISECTVNCPYSISIYNHSQPVKNYSGLGIQSASSFINSSKDYYLNNNDFLAYSAGDHVLLSPGFLANINNNATFSAYISGCTQDPTNYTENQTWSTYNHSKSNVTGTLNTETINKSKYIHIYPNPNNGSFTVELSQKGTYKIKVSNIVGVVIFENSLINEQKTNIVLNSSIPAGNYIVQIEGEGVNHIQKLTLMK